MPTRTTVAASTEGRGPKGLREGTREIWGVDCAARYGDLNGDRRVMAPLVRRWSMAAGRRRGHFGAMMTHQSALKGKHPVRTAGVVGRDQAAANMLTRFAFQFQGSRSTTLLAG